MRPPSREFKRLVALSRRWGADPHQAQASGGNVSMKSGDGRLLVKASGARLRELTEREGWAVSRLGPLLAGLRGLSARPAGPGRERAYAELLRRSSRGPRPSMEAGFHAAIPDRFVVHLHSSAGIALGMLGRERALARARRVAGGRFRPEYLPPCAPGCDLTAAILGQAPSRAPVTLRLLANHGLIWSGDDLGEVQAAVAAFERSLRPSLALARLVPLHVKGAAPCRLEASPLSPGWREVCACRWPAFPAGLDPLFPDFAVFFDLWGGDPDLVRTSACSAALRAETPAALRDKVEVLFSHWAVRAACARLRARPRPLPLPVIRRIKGLETERARLAQMKALARGKAR